MDLRINWDHKRARHTIERMWLRGISAREVEEAIMKGKKVRQKNTRLIEAYLRHFSVVYDERHFKKTNTWKVYPVTVKLW